MNMDDVLSVITASKTAVLSTVTESGYPESRALLNLADAKKYPRLKGKAALTSGNSVILYYTTNTSSRKMTQLRNNPKVSLYFCIPAKFQGVCAVGDIAEVTDRNIKKDFWHTGWRIYNHKGCDDPDYTLLKFTSKEIRCWSGFAVHEFR